MERDNEEEGSGRNFATLLYMFKFYLLGHLVEDVESFENLETLDVSLLQKFNKHIKRVRRNTSQQWVLGMLGSGEVMGAAREERQK